MSDEPCTGEPATVAIVTVVTEPKLILGGEVLIMQRGPVQVVDFYAVEAESQ